MLAGGVTPLALKPRPLRSQPFHRRSHPCGGSAQSVALNMSNGDLPVQLHFALFNSSSGYIIKPPEMRAGDEDGDDPLTPRSAQLQLERRRLGSDIDESTYEVRERASGLKRDDYWPPPREWLHRTTVKILNLSCLPKVISLAPTSFFAWCSQVAFIPSPQPSCPLHSVASTGRATVAVVAVATCMRLS